MTDALRAGPMTMLDGIAVVFDDGSRIRWSRAGGGTWALAEPWPNPEELAAIDQHLASGGRALVVTDGQPITSFALSSELPSLGDAHHENEVFEITLTHFDWLPDPLRARGEAFLLEELERWSTVPTVLRPPVILDRGTDEPHAVGQVGFALLAPGVTRSRLEGEALEYLVHPAEAQTWVQSNA